MTVAMLIEINPEAEKCLADQACCLSGPASCSVSFAPSYYGESGPKALHPVLVYASRLNFGLNFSARNHHSPSRESSAFDTPIHAEHSTDVVTPLSRCTNR